VSHQEKQESVGGDVEVEIDKTVNQKAAASCHAGELQRGGKRGIELAKPFYGLPEQNTQKPSATEPPEYARFGQGLEVVVVGMVDDSPVVKGFVRRINNLQGAKTRSS
jgi:hypothetical protein